MFEGENVLRKVLGIDAEEEIKKEMGKSMNNVINGLPVENLTLEKGTGLRFNEGKVQHDLIPPWAINEVGKVFTEGANKYAKHNWRRGMKWSFVLASLKRHLNAFERGLDFDKEFTDKGTKIYHMAQVATNALFLLEYHKIYPQGDDRLHWYLNAPKIGLDIDDVLAAWVKGWTTYYRMDVPTSWFFDRSINDKLNQMKIDGTLDDFYLGLEPKINPNEIPFEPHCYITSRPVSTKITEQWLDMHGFPARPVYTVEMGQSKVDIAKNAGVEIFVDDRFDNFVDFNRNGVCCYLFDANHNQRYDVGERRVKRLKDLPYDISF